MRRGYLLGITALLVSTGPGLSAQTAVGTFRWQLHPYCNILTLAVTQNGGVYRLEGTDDQCGAGGPAASVVGTAFLNPDGTVGMGFNIVAAPGGAPTPVAAQITIASLGGTWRDAAGHTGAFVFTPGAGAGGSPRPLPAVVIPTAIQLRPDGGLLAGGALDVGTIPASGAGARMMWYPNAAAFRAGVVTSTQWDDANIGPFSVAFGQNTTARGYASTALGANTKAEDLATTAMGLGSIASSLGSTAMGLDARAGGTASMAMGSEAIAIADFSTAMGRRTIASGLVSTAMGDRTTASGEASMAIGRDSQAIGNNSFAGVYGIARGHRSVALGVAEVLAGASGSFVWGDTSDTSRAEADQPNQFVVRAAGGVRFHTNAAMSSGVVMFNGASAWSPLSDRNMKAHVRALDGEDVLGKLAAMPVTEWSYTTQDASIRHVGPMAQDFHAAFGLGEDGLRISTIDADGIALAGVKALEARTREMNDRLSRENDELRSRLARLEALLDKR